MDDDAPDTDESDTTPGPAADADDDAIADRAVAELRAAVTHGPDEDEPMTDESAADKSAADEPAAGTRSTERSTVGSGSTGGSATGRDDPRIPTNALFELLSAPGNRFVLTYLLRAKNPTTYADLVDYVVERAAPPADTTDAKFRGRVAARLVHNTIPDLAAAGLIEHDAEEQTVRATPAIEIAAPHLALAMSRPITDDAE